jgi:hypothetical protein
MCAGSRNGEPRRSVLLEHVGRSDRRGNPCVGLALRGFLGHIRERRVSGPTLRGWDMGAPSALG